MEKIIKKLNKSGLFPENVRNFLIESVKNGNLNKAVLSELEKMLYEEEKAIEAIRKKS